MASNKLTWDVLERVLRHLPEWQELYEQEGIEELTYGGVTVNIHDILDGLGELPPRQKEAIELLCLRNMRECDAAAVMLPGSTWASPVGGYKRTGLRKLAQRFNETEAAMA